jgi:hypothetical protein
MDNDWTAASIGMYNGCGLRGTGLLFCWGKKDSTGLGDYTGNQVTPAQVGTNTSWISVNVNGRISLGIRGASGGGLETCGLGGINLTSGQSATFYDADIALDCDAIKQTRTCADGSLTGATNYKYGSCTTLPPTGASCTLDGVTVTHGASHVFYQNDRDLDCASNSMRRICNNGVLTESTIYDESSCGAAWVCRLTTSTFTGSIGGVAGGDTKCQAQYGAGWTMGSRDYVNYDQDLSPIDEMGWVKDHTTNHCNNWTNGTASYSGTAHSRTRTGYGTTTRACSTATKIWCCQ